MTKVIAYRERTWLHPRTDQRQWDHLCRAFEVELQLIDSWEEAVIPPNSVIVGLDEQGSVDLKDLEHLDNMVYVFGRTLMNPLEAEYDVLVKINTPKDICLFGVTAAAIVLGDREWR